MAREQDLLIDIKAGIVSEATLCANGITIVSTGKPNQLMELLTRVPSSTKPHFAREMTVEFTVSASVQEHSWELVQFNKLFGGAQLVRHYFLNSRSPRIMQLEGPGVTCLPPHPAVRQGQARTEPNGKEVRKKRCYRCHGIHSNGLHGNPARRQHSGPGTELPPAAEKRVLTPGPWPFVHIRGFATYRCSLITPHDRMN